MESLEKRIETDIMSAMKSKDEVRLSALRSVKTAIQNEKTNHLPMKTSSFSKFRTTPFISTFLSSIHFISASCSRYLL